MRLGRMNNFLKILFVAVTLVASVSLPNSVLAAGSAVVSVSAPTQAISSGTQFTVNIIAQPNNAIAGVQFNLSFNPSLVSVNSIEEGNLFNQNGANTYFIPGTINNTTGTINGVAGAIIGNGQTVSTPGTLAVITITSSVTGGTCPFTLSNVIVGDTNGQSVPVNMVNGQVIISGSSTTTTPPSSGGGGGGGPSSTTTTTPPPSGGGGGIGPSSAITVAGVKDITSVVNAQGSFSQDVNVYSDDNNFLLHITAGTTGLTSSGSSLTQISILHMITPPTFPAGAGMVSLAYDFTPSGTTFNPTANITCSYDPTLIPTGVEETSLQIAYYDSTTSAWITLPSKVDIDSHSVSAQIAHFTPYAVTYGVNAVTPPPTTTITKTATMIPPPTTTTVGTITTATTTTSVMSMPTTTITTATSLATIEPLTTPNNPPPSNTPVVRMAILASAIGVALIILSVTVSLILLRRRQLLKKGSRLK